jgi:predicted nucleic acid-binding protein
MTVVWDTSVVIDILRGSPGAIRYAEGLEEVPACSEITRVEVLQGVRVAERGATERLLRGITWIPLDESIARRAGAIGRQWRRSHPGISTPDLVIAATAEELGAPLATANIRHFPMFPGLRTPYRG